MNTVSKVSIVRIASLSTFLLACSLILPRVIPDEGGFASATSAALIFIALFVVSVVLAVWALAKTARSFSAITNQARIIGIAPTIFLIAAGLWVYLQL
jgi:threonine/homoserine/homoserine lactone efflux protein